MDFISVFFVQGLASTILKIIFSKFVEIRMMIISEISHGFFNIPNSKKAMAMSSMIDNFQKYIKIKKKTVS